MSMSEKRKSPRVSSIHLFNYVHLGLEEKDPDTQGMGRTINLSKSGIMLETHIPFIENNTLDVVVGLKEDMLTLRGKIVFSKATDSGQYQSGIEFLSLDDKSEQILQRYIDAFNVLPPNASA